MSRLAFAVFAVFVALYAGSMAPALAPYRDSGEMAAAAATLSVAHPTSYPSYILLGRLSQRLPLGNPAYRLSLLSAAAAALACAAMFAAARRRWGLWAGLGAAALLGLNGTFWSVAQVQEMYSLGTLAAVALLALGLRLSDAYSERLWRGLCFAFGLALTNRLDLLLWAPGLLWLALSSREERRSPLWASAAFLIVPALQAALGSNWPIVALIGATALWRCPRPERPRWALASAACGAAGLSLYAFLPVRSASGPWLDWNHPALPGNFLESLLRSRYGGTLDLLSKSYGLGELFGANLALYGRHLWDAFSLPGLALAAWGCARCARAAPRRWLGQAACWWWAGPVFLFIANLPPNPHAAAIVEPHYLLSDVVLVFWAAEGLGAAAAAAPWLGPACAAALLAAPLALGRLSRYDRREHLFSYDFAADALRAAPPSAVVVAKKDVPLYALWSYQRLQGWRPDARVVAQGLAGSLWYQRGWRRVDPSLTLLPLVDSDAWRRFAALNGAVLAAPDAELAPEVMAACAPRGLLCAVGGEPAPLEPRLWELEQARGAYDYDAAPDFFTADLIDERAQARSRLGSALALANRPAQAERELRRAWAMHWELPEAPLLLGYIAYTSGRLDEALRLYGQAAAILDGLLGAAARYRSLPGVVLNIRRSAAEAYMHLGVVSDKLGRREDAQRYYAASLEREPLAQTHFNLAVLYWGRDWDRVQRELEEALRLDPRHAQAARYLRQLRGRSR